MPIPINIFILTNIITGHHYHIFYSIYIYTYIIYIHIYIYIYTCVYIYVCMYVCMYIYYGHISVSSPVFTRTRFSDGFCIVPLLQDLAKLVADQELLAQAMETMAGGEEK